jgi:hypothetical protein
MLVNDLRDFYDQRNNLTAWHGGDALVLAVAAHNNNTIVVVQCWSVNIGTLDRTS